MQNRSHKLRIVILFLGLCLALLCQVGLSPSESGSGGASHGTAICAQSLMIPTAYVLAYSRIITPVAAIALDEPAQEHTLPFYRPPRPTA